MRTKGQAFGVFQRFIRQAKRQSEKKLRHPQTLFGVEFGNQAFEEYTSKEAVSWEPSDACISEQKSKSERLHYTLISLVCSVLSAMHLQKTPWDVLIKIVVYRKNRSSSNYGITLYEPGNHICPNINHLKVVGSWTWVHILKEKRLKLDRRSWQGIFIRYGKKNQYRVYNSRTEKVHITRDVLVNKQHLYYRESLNNWDCEENDLTKIDDTSFADVDKIESLDMDNSPN